MINGGLAVIDYGREVQDPLVARNLEFLMTAGSSWASGSVGGNTRKYHGLFVRDGRLLLAGLDETVNGVRISSQPYAGFSNDAGLRHLHAFSAYPPSWIYVVGTTIVKKTITFEGSLRVTYDVAGEADLAVRPLITSRPVHELRRDPDPGCSQEAGGFRWEGLRLDGDLAYEPQPSMYRNAWYEREQERGYAAAEDLFSPGIFAGNVRDAAVTLRCADTAGSPGEPPAQRRSPQGAIGWLEWAADAFVRGDEIVAGYPWFTETWGRDSAISVPGLLIGRGLRDKARAVLRRLAALQEGGLIPNRYPDNYHASDASLWFIHALLRYRQRWGDDAFMEEMVPVIGAILTQYPSSPVATLDRGLITVPAGSTWMDTRFTPRNGKPVEVNALWVHALTEAEGMGIPTPVDPASARKEFRRFWNPERQCLCDLLDPADPAVRPNQVIALALGIVEPEIAAASLATVTAQLATPYGLRSLSPADPHYQGAYAGDSSYHNGCVWPWLTGYYTEALLKNGVPRQAVARTLDPILHHIREAGMGYISEILDGDPPFLPRGCIAQAWSVAEIARAYRLVVPPA